MKIQSTLTLSILLIFLSCKEIKKDSSSGKDPKVAPSDLLVDHFNIWVNDPQLAKEKLNAIGFTSLPDSISAVHSGQGTSGRYFYFLDNYLELIFVYDQAEFEANNRINKALDFAERSDFENSGASPFSIALKVNDYAIDKIPFEKVEYHQEWMGEDGSIFSAKNSKINLQEPSLFVVYPKIESEVFETMDDIEQIPDEYAFAGAFYKHPNGAQKVTNIVITSIDLDLNSETIKSINDIENTTIKNGATHLMELYFDGNIQGKTFDLRPDLPLKIYL